MKFAFPFIVVLIFPFSLWAQDAVKRDPRQMHELHRDPQSYIGVLEDPQRDAYQKPYEVLNALKIKPGEVIADIGAGSGYFTFRLAHFVGDKGRVYAVDVSPEMIRHINRRIRDLKATNVVSILADPDDPLLSDRSINRFFICDVWHHIANPTKYLSLMKRMLKPGGEIIMIDFEKKDLPVGPPAQMKIAREDLLKQIQDNGFKLVREHRFLQYQYFFVFVTK